MADRTPTQTISRSNAKPLHGKVCINRIVLLIRFTSKADKTITETPAVALVLEYIAESTRESTGRERKPDRFGSVMALDF